MSSGQSSFAAPPAPQSDTSHINGCHAAEGSTKSLRETFNNLLQESGMDMPEGLTATSESEEDR